MAASTSTSSGSPSCKYTLRQQDDILPSILAKLPPSAPEVIKFRICVRNMVDLNVPTDTNEINAVVASFQAEDDAFRLLTYILSPMGVPEYCQRKILAPAIFNFTKTILADPQNALRRWVGVVVEINVLAPTHHHYHKNNDVPDMLPSRVGEDLNRNNLECVICYEKLSASVNFVSLPCSHMYHWHCIIRWLREGDRCPTCRRDPLPRD